MRDERLVDNMVDVLASKKNYKIPNVWKGKKWFSEEIREAVTRRNIAYKKALYTNTEFS